MHVPNAKPKLVEAVVADAVWPKPGTVEEAEFGPRDYTDSTPDRRKPNHGAETVLTVLAEGLGAGIKSGMISTPEECLDLVLHLRETFRREPA